VRPSEIAFRCPACGGEATAGLDGHGRCGACAATPALPVPPALRDTRVIEECPACQGRSFYVQRDFNQKVGLGIVVVGGILAPFTPFYSSLIVAALVDAALYLVLPEITICYRCLAHFRGFLRNPKHEAFDLHIAEQYGKPSSPP
jgi:hypothetical protein